MERVQFLDDQIDAELVGPGEEAFGVIDAFAHGHFDVVAASNAEVKHIGGLIDERHA